MTVQELTQKVNAMIEDDKQYIQKLINKAINSGCMDIEGAENNYLLPKALLSAIYKEMSRQYSPLPKGRNRQQEKEIENIYRFL